MAPAETGGVAGGVPSGTPNAEGVFDEALVGRIANELYADTPPAEPQSAVPKSDPVRGRDVNEEASSLTDVGNVPENALGLPGRGLAPRPRGSLVLLHGASGDAGESPGDAPGPRGGGADGRHAP